jgi:apolipoprotein D and lipocalin family protein
LTGLEDGTVGVYNTCNDPTTGELRSISGVATNNDPSTNAQFTVDFGLPHTGQYWIIGLGENYEYAVVSDPSLLSLYILSKTPQLSPDLYAEAVEKAQRQVDVSKLRVTEQRNCEYPAL